MERTATQPAHNDRTRYLNIVYFVESARSHTIRINLKYARWTVGGALVVFAWAAGSVFWIASLRWQVQETRDRLESSLTTIFDYQIKNDKVFELAYPADATKSYYSETAQLASNNPILDSKNQVPASEDNPAHKSQPLAATSTPQVPATQKVSNTGVPEKPTTKTAEPLATTTSAGQVVAVSAAATPKATQGESQTLIHVSGAKISKAASKLELVFDINNPHEERAAGYIWAVAAFTGQDGKTTYVGAPNHVQLEAETGNVKSFKTAYRFSIQRYKKKDFEFKTPKMKDWKLSKMTIHFTDINHKNEESFNVPVDQLAAAQNSEEPAAETNL